MFKKTKIILLFVIVTTFALVIPTYAETLWYNGDFDGYGGLMNGDSTFIKTKVYDDFLVDGSGWVIDEVWSNNLIWNNVDINIFNQAYWEIRSGVSRGNGGNLIASGTGSVTPVSTGNSWFNLMNEYTIKVSELDVALEPGTYWLAVVPRANTLIVDSYISTTSGANAIGIPQGDNENGFFDWPSGGYNFTPAEETYSGSYRNFSMGIGGTSRDIVPEPSSLLLMGFGSIVTAFIKRRHEA